MKTNKGKHSTSETFPERTDLPIHKVRVPGFQSLYPCKPILVTEEFQISGNERGVMRTKNFLLNGMPSQGRHIVGGSMPGGRWYRSPSRSPPAALPDESGAQLTLVKRQQLDHGIRPEAPPAYYKKCDHRDFLV